MAKGGKLTKLMKKLSLGKTSHSQPQEPNTSFLHPVYVGQSRRRYMVTSDVVAHPLFRQLTAKSTEDDVMVVGCEVVMFEHLLWMLENADPQPESLHELAEFYAC